MNRIVIIGNGFDLAHGLKTSYANFIESYWAQWVEKLKSSTTDFEDDELCIFNIRELDTTWDKFMQKCYEQYPYMTPSDFIDKIDDGIFEGFSITSISPLFEEIRKNYQDKNWLGIEEDYYRLLCAAKSVAEVKKLNDDLAEIKKLLAKYLKSQHADDFIREIWLKIYQPFEYREIANSSKDKWNEFVLERLKHKDDIIDIYMPIMEKRETTLLEYPK